MIAGWVLVFAPVDFSNLGFSKTAETNLAWSLIIGFAFGFLLKRLRWIEHIDTWIHEFGHAAAGTFFGHAPEFIKLNQDTSGVTQFRYQKMGRIPSVILSAAGPLGTVVSMYLCISLAGKGFTFLILPLLAFIVILVLLSSVRSGWGWFVGILVLASIVFTFMISQVPVLGLFNASAKEIYLGAFLGIASGVAIRASFARLRMHGPHGDEGHIAAELHVPEILVDVVILILHVGVIWLTFSHLDAVPKISDYVSNTPEIQSKFQEVVNWFQTLPFMKG